MENKTELIAEEFRKIQQVVCAEIEACDTKAKFSNDVWRKEVGSGVTKVIKNGAKIEKGAVNFSQVTGKLSPQLKENLGVDGTSYSAAGISSILHGKNPFSPTIHMNVRYFYISEKVNWFGGGIDLTPMYVNEEEARYFHQKIKAICGQYHPNRFEEFKKNADDYFYLPHRKETRGIGGIFYDRQAPNDKNEFQNWLDFSKELTLMYSEIYCQLLENNFHKPFNKSHLDWQNLRRGRYVEFNLLYDRGTKFGLQNSGNTESIFVSMPPNASWEYQHETELGSEEEKTQDLLKKGINWISER